MLWKNFGVTRHGKVVFYDYDEIEYITDCNFRRVPPPRNERRNERRDLVIRVGKYDVFPETFAPSCWAIQRCARCSCNTTRTCWMGVLAEPQGTYRRGACNDVSL